MSRRVYSDEQREEALRLHEQDGPSAAAKATGIPKGTIAAWARRGGVHTVRNEKTRNATEARTVDLKGRRSEIAEQLLDHFASIAQQLDAPTETVSAGAIVLTEKPTPEASQRLVTTMGILIDKHLALTKHDADNGASEARSLLDSLREQIGMSGE